MATKNDRKSLMTTGGLGRAPNRAMLRGVGFLDEDFDRPMIGVASLFSRPRQVSTALLASRMFSRKAASL